MSELIDVHCTHCGALHQAQASDAGQDAECVSCGRVFTMWFEEPRPAAGGEQWYLRVRDQELGPFQSKVMCLLDCP